MVERVSGRAVPVREVGRRSGDPPSLVADAGKAARILGWRARQSTLQHIVETAWNSKINSPEKPAGVAS